MKRNVAVVANNPSINPTTGITIAAWVNSTDWLGNRRIMQKGDGDNPVPLTRGERRARLPPHGHHQRQHHRDLPTNAAFHHLAGTYDGAYVRLYVDGKIVAEELALGTIATTGGNLHIGLKTPVAPPGDGFFGVMDEVVLYDRGLYPTSGAPRQRRATALTCVAPRGIRFPPVRAAPLHDLGRPGDDLVRWC
jgi:hypothetical protein